MSTTKITSTTAPDGTTTTVIEVEHHGGKPAAIPEACPPGPPVVFNNGCFGFIFKSEWESAAACAEWHENAKEWQATEEMVGNITSKYIQDGPTTSWLLNLYPSADAWVKYNNLFAGGPKTMETIAKCTKGNGYAFGVGNAAVDAALAGWNSLPQLDCNLYESCSGTILRAESTGAAEFGYMFMSEFKSPADADAYIANASAMMPLSMNFANNNCSVRISPTATVGFTTFASVEKWGEQMAAMQEPGNSHIIEQMVAGVKTNNCVCFGPVDSSSAAAIAQWDSVPGWSVAPSVPPACGLGADGPMGFVNLITYNSPADLEKWTKHIHENWVPAAKKCGATTKVLVKKSDTEVIMLAQFPDNATWLEYNAIIGADPKVPEMFTTLTFKNQMLGMCNVDTHATIEAWNQAPQMTLLKGTPLVGRSGDTTEKSIQFTIDWTFNTPEGLENFVQMAYAPEVLASHYEAKNTEYVFKTGPMSAMTVGGHASTEAWLKQNDLNKAVMGPVIQADVASATCHWWGETTDAGRAAVAEWDAAPNITMVECAVAAGFVG